MMPDHRHAAARKPVCRQALDFLCLVPILAVAAFGAQAWAAQADDAEPEAATVTQQPATPSVQPASPASKEKIRQALLKLLGWQAEEWSAEMLAEHRQFVSGADYFRARTSGEDKELFAAALDLAIHGDDSGAEILLYPDSFMQGDRIDLYAFAALALIDRAPRNFTPRNFIFPEHADKEETPLLDALASCLLPREERQQGWPFRMPNVREVLQEQLKLPRNLPLKELVRLRQLVSGVAASPPESDVAKTELLSAAITLAFYGDASGAWILRYPKNYAKASTNIENLHVFAALALIGQAPEASVNLSGTGARLIDALLPHGLHPPPNGEQGTWPPELAIRPASADAGSVRAGDANVAAQTVNKEKVRQALLEIFSKTLHYSDFAELRQKVSAAASIPPENASDRRDLFDAAITLAILDDASGAEILLHPYDYRMTSSGYEDLFAFAALALIDRQPQGVAELGINNSLKDWNLAATLAPYLSAVEETAWPPPPLWSVDSANPETAQENTEPNAEATGVAQSAHKEKIREILRQRTDTPEKLSPKMRAKLRQLVSATTGNRLASGPDGETQFFAAIKLAVHGDASGARILLNADDYFNTNSDFENDLAFAALMLINRVPDGFVPLGIDIDEGLANALAPWTHVSPKAN
ncbi:MAG: hypothetical protein LBE62_13520 [Azonexus sp.]|jgi:hypothetical protein|nr:hypothetical protein [Azonexus sp.]